MSSRSMSSSSTSKRSLTRADEAQRPAGAILAHVLGRPHGEVGDREELLDRARVARRARPAGARGLDELAQAQALVRLAHRVEQAVGELAQSVVVDVVGDDCELVAAQA